MEGVVAIYRFSDAIKEVIISVVGQVLPLSPSFKYHNLLRFSPEPVNRPALMTTSTEVILVVFMHRNILI